MGGSVFPLSVWRNITSRGAVIPQVEGYHRRPSLVTCYDRGAVSPQVGGCHRADA